MWIEQMQLPRDQMSDIKQYSNPLQLDLVPLLVNFLHDLGQIVSR